MVEEVPETRPNKYAALEIWSYNGQNPDLASWNSCAIGICWESRVYLHFSCRQLDTAS